MQESTRAAHSNVWSHARELGIDGQKVRSRGVSRYKATNDHAALGEVASDLKTNIPAAYGR